MDLKNRKVGNKTKYEMKDFIIESSVTYKSGWKVGTCMYCGNKLRSNKWNMHLDTCKRQPKPNFTNKN